MGGGGGGAFELFLSGLGEGGEGGNFYTNDF